MNRGPAISRRASWQGSIVGFADRGSGDHDPGPPDNTAVKRPREFGRNGDVAKPRSPEPSLSSVRLVVGTSAAPIPGSAWDGVPPRFIAAPSASRPVGRLGVITKRREEFDGSVAVKKNWEP